MKWWGASFFALTCRMDFREGGRTLVGHAVQALACRFCSRSPVDVALAVRAVLPPCGRPASRGLVPDFGRGALAAVQQDPARLPAQTSIADPGAVRGHGGL
jgi:hypothetical protein